MLRATQHRKPLRRTIEEDGYVVLRKLLTTGEVSRLRSALLTHFAGGGQPEFLGKHERRAAVEIPGIRWLLTHPAIVQAFQEILGTRGLVFTGQCEAHLNTLSVWQKDGLESGLCRAALYLQDHIAGDGFMIRRQSHRSTSLETGEIEPVLTRRGDVVVFDPRLTHCGLQPDPFERLLYRITRRLRCEALGARIKEQYWKVTMKPTTLALFFTFATSSREGDGLYPADARNTRRGEPPPILPRDLVSALRLAGISAPAGTRRPAASQADVSERRESRAAREGARS
jgi:hypothetical protein